MELWAQWHGVNHDRLFIWVIVEDDDLKQATCAVSADHEVSVDARDNSQGMAKCVLHVFVAYAVLARAVRDLHHDKVALSSPRVKVYLSGRRSETGRRASARTAIEPRRVGPRDRQTYVWGTIWGTN